jgi:hypothetical protein
MTTQRIQATVGPYAGQHIDVPADVAKAAIRDGWAIDPYAAASDEPAKEYDHEKALEAAVTAARKLRGEEEPAKRTRKTATQDEGSETTTSAQTRTLEADKTGEAYKTRSVSKPKDE